MVAATAETVVGAASVGLVGTDGRAEGSADLESPPPSVEGGSDSGACCVDDGAMPDGADVAAAVVAGGSATIPVSAIDAAPARAAVPRPHP